MSKPHRHLSFTSLDDDVVPVQNSIKYALAMKKHHVTCELHIYESGGHGYGMAPRGSTQSMWPEACRKWLEANRFKSLEF